MDLTRLWLTEGRGKRNYFSRHFNQRVTINFYGNRVESIFLYKSNLLITEDNNEPTTEYRPELIINPIKPEYEITRRAFNKDDAKFWNRFGINESLANRFGLYAVDTITTKQNACFIEAKEQMCYEMSINNNCLTKIYRPEYEKYGGNKWISYGHTDNPCLWDKIDRSHNTVCLCSGMKDALCLYAQMDGKIDVLFLNSETATVSPSIDAMIKSFYKHIYICYDNDDTGVAKSKSISNMYGYTNIEIPHVVWLFDVKDIAEFYQFNNKDSIDYFKSKIKTQ